jgi:hypothetical protein
MSAVPTNPEDPDTMTFIAYSSRDQRAASRQ